MNHEAIRIRIGQLTTEIRTAAFEIQTSGAPDAHSTEAMMFQTKLARWENALSAIRQTIKNQENFAMMTTGPAAQRQGGYPVKDQNRSLMQNAAQLKNALLDGLMALAMLKDALYGSGQATRTALEAISGGLENILAEDGTFAVKTNVQQQVATIVQAQGPGVPPSNLPSLAGHGVDVFVIWLGFIAMLRAKFKKK